MKNFRTIATSLLLFQHCLFPVTIFAEEAPVEIDTELVQRLQEQNELPAIESSPPTTEATAEEPVHTEPAEVPTTEDSNPEQPEQSEQPKQPETVETTEPPIPETSEETVETTTPSTEDGKESSEENEPPSPVLPAKEETEQLMVLPKAMRMSTYSLPNLSAYRHHLVNNGKSAYIEKKMQAATNRTLTLGAEVGATQSFTVSYDTHTMVQEAGNGWISWIASNLSGTPDYYFQQMYYGNHPTYSNPYTLGNLRWSGVPSYLAVTASTPSISNYRVTFNVTIRRTGVATNDKDTLRLLGNLTMGTTAVAPAVNNFSKKIENVNYSGAVIGEINVNNPRPSVVIKDSVVVEATRNALSQDTIKSWFSTLPSNSNDYTFSATGPASWAPGATGTATVVMKHNSNGTTQTFTTRYTVRDTQAPTGTVKNGAINVEVRRSGNLSEEELRGFMATMSDNWTLTEKIKVNLINADGSKLSVAGVKPGTALNAYIQLEDEAGNKSKLLPITLRIVDTQKPTAKFKTQGVEIEARRTGGWTREDLLKFIDGNLQDNWSLSKNIRIEATDNNGIYPITGRAPGSAWAYVDIYDEAGNKYGEDAIYFKIVDKQAPTGTVKNGAIDVEARRSGNLSEEELRGFMATMSDNWTLPENIKFHLVNADGSAASIAGVKPGTALDAHIQLEDEAGNKSKLLPITLRIVDTQAPTGTVKNGAIDVEARRSGNLSQEELRGFMTTMSDNWTLPENIKFHLVNADGSAASIAGVKPGTALDAHIQLEDEAGNKSKLLPITLRIVDTQAPTGTVKNGAIDVEARRSGNLSQEELRGFMTTMSDNWTLPENIKFHLVNADGSAASIAGVKPGTALDAHIQLEDEAGNKSAPMKISARIVDTVGPQGTVKENLSFYEGSAEPNVRDYLEGKPSDNWTLPEAIKATIVYENNAEFTDLKVGTHKFILTLTDESGNTTDFSGQLKIKKDLRGYIDVTIPVRISFAESKESGGIVSPKYKIQNNSNEELTVSVASMTSQSQTEKLTDIDLLMSNNYNDSTIPLIENGQNLSQKTELVTLPKKTSSFAFSLSGTVGQNFDFDSLTDPLKPQYALQFNFEIN
ncbi:hypothetical protein [Enterococcus durans]|uniref:hypothetical protein n=1 Tax=Enterococcus durans TaxID=53345 RepID=UPI001F0FD8EF|nr:hypothetical protein [Enterococcus durans]